MARKQQAKKAVRLVSKTTLLIVGEGPSDQAFIQHMYQQLRDEGMKVRPKIEKQSGGSPGNIIENAIRKYQNDAYDQRIFVLDSDVPVTQQHRDKARKHGYRFVLWSPVCMEGALLDVLDESVAQHESAQQLKDRLYPRLVGPATDPKAYESLFPKAVLQSSTNASVNDVRDTLMQQSSAER